MDIVDKNLRNGARTVGALNHNLFLIRRHYDIDLAKLDALLRQKSLRAVTETAKGTGIDFYFRHLVLRSRTLIQESSNV